MIRREDIMNLQDLFKVENTEYEINVGKEVMMKRKGMLEARKGMIVQVQKIMSPKEPIGYTVYDYTTRFTYACRFNEVEIID